MKATRFYTLLALLLMAGIGMAHGQNMTEIHYYSKVFHGPNMVCQAKDGNIIVECSITQGNEAVGSKLLKFDRQGNCLDSLYVDDEAKVKSNVFANPLGEGDVLATLRCSDNNVSVRIQHLDEHLTITEQADVLLPVQWSGLYAERFFVDGNHHLIIAINDSQRQNYRLARVSLDGELLDCVEASRFKQLRVTFAGTPFFQYSESPLQYGFVAMPTQGNNTSPHLFILDSSFNVTVEGSIATINGANVNYSNMQAVARLNDDEWLYSCRMGLQSDGEFWNQLTKFDNQMQYQADFQVHNEGTQGNTTCYPIPEGSVKVTGNGTIYHVCMDYLMLFPGYLNITCLNSDFSMRWQRRYPEEPGFPFGTNMCVLDDGTAVVCGYSTDNNVYDMFLLLFENEGESIAETEPLRRKVEAYPNPGGNTINIRTALPNAYVEVYDLNGKLIHHQAITDETTSINAENWASGSYVWKVYTGGPSTLRQAQGPQGSGTLVETGKWIKE